MSEFQVGDKVTAVSNAPGRFANYIGKTGIVVEISPNGKVIEVAWGEYLRDWLDPGSLELTPPGDNDTLTL